MLHLCIPRRPGPALRDHGHAPLGDGSRAALARLKRLTTASSAPGSSACRTAVPPTLRPAPTETSARVPQPRCTDATPERAA